MIRPVEWRNGAVVLLDQRLLPAQEVYRVYRDHREVARAIKDMVVRGAPAIGVTAAMGIALGMRTAGPRDLARSFDRICKRFAATRPTAVNLFWAIDRMRRAFESARGRSAEVVREILRQEALAIHAEDIANNRALGRFGAPLLPKRGTVLTHCNAGALATAGYGTALGVIRAAREAGKSLHVLADETRPFLQGARLTAWELQKDKIPVTVITDSMAGHLFRKGAIDAVIVGADRIAANGDTANKIGTYTVAVLAARHGVPFYVAAPVSTIDVASATGDDIPIEERPPHEVTHVLGEQITPRGVKVANPAFDVTPNALIAAIITDRGVARRPYGRALAKLLRADAPPSRSPSRRIVRRS
jgi:methylthioribose-1-phosphate isomerase